LSRYFFVSSRRRHTRSKRDWSSDVCSSDLAGASHRFFVCSFLFISNCWGQPLVPRLQFSCFIEPLVPATGSSIVVFSFYRTAGSSYRFFVCSIPVLFQ